MTKQHLSVVLATFNEEKNLADCLTSVKRIATEIVVVDGTSTDKTVEIAKTFGAKVIVTNNPPIFHINKQKALDAATYSWILQLDADERVSQNLADEITQILSLEEKEVAEYQKKLLSRELFLAHQQLLEKRDGMIGTQEGPYQAFFVPRLNNFLGRNLRYGGVYPDGVIRLVKKGRVHFPCKDVHEQMVVDGRVGWLQQALIHKDSPTFARYLQRNNRYIDLLAQELREKGVRLEPVSLVKYGLFLPSEWFIKTFIRHKGFLDSWQGFVFSFFSALRFPRAYKRAVTKK